MRTEFLRKFSVSSVEIDLQSGRFSMLHTEELLSDDLTYFYFRKNHLNTSSVAGRNITSTVIEDQTE